MAAVSTSLYVESAVRIQRCWRRHRAWTELLESTDALAAFSLALQRAGLREIDPAGLRRQQVPQGAPRASCSDKQLRLVVALAVCANNQDARRDQEGIVQTVRRWLERAAAEVLLEAFEGFEESILALSSWPGCREELAALVAQLVAGLSQSFRWFDEASVRQEAQFTLLDCAEAAMRPRPAAQLMVTDAAEQRHFFATWVASDVLGWVLESVEEELGRFFTGLQNPHLFQRFIELPEFGVAAAAFRRFADNMPAGRHYLVRVSDAQGVGPVLLQLVRRGQHFGGVLQASARIFGPGWPGTFSLCYAEGGRQFRMDTRPEHVPRQGLVLAHLVARQHSSLATFDDVLGKVATLLGTAFEIDRELCQLFLSEGFQTTPGLPAAFVVLLPEDFEGDDYFHIFDRPRKRLWTTRGDLSEFLAWLRRLQEEAAALRRQQQQQQQREQAERASPELLQHRVVMDTVAEQLASFRADTAQQIVQEVQSSSAAMGEFLSSGCRYVMNYLGDSWFGNGGAEGNEGRQRREDSSDTDDSSIASLLPGVQASPFALCFPRAIEEDEEENAATDGEDEEQHTAAAVYRIRPLIGPPAILTLLKAGTARLKYEWTVRTVVQMSQSKVLLAPSVGLAQQAMHLAGYSACGAMFGANILGPPGVAVGAVLGGLGGQVQRLSSLFTKDIINLRTNYKYHLGVNNHGQLVVAHQKAVSNGSPTFFLKVTVLSQMAMSASANIRRVLAGQKTPGQAAMQVASETMGSLVFLGFVDGTMQTANVVATSPVVNHVATQLFGGLTTPAAHSTACITVGIIVGAWALKRTALYWHGAISAAQLEADCVASLASNVSIICIDTVVRHYNLPLPFPAVMNGQMSMRASLLSCDAWMQYRRHVGRRELVESARRLLGLSADNMTEEAASRRARRLFVLTHPNQNTAPDAAAAFCAVRQARDLIFQELQERRLEEEDGRQLRGQLSHPLLRRLEVFRRQLVRWSVARRRDN
eukprot:TRINITY_DN26293_c0_g2_i1.p1 TRINITY_DN26293_c0_g2~~TRINITY_DN26293_c0_g2_i1.p1  ORF type:complete len:986 (-),score=215.04 TRINITY_DN26293_c0_g2_i1:544-3501(-)